MGNPVLGYTTQIYGENSAATDCCVLNSWCPPPVSWEGMTPELAAVSLANGLWTASSESGSISMAGICCSSSHAPLREVRVKFCSLSLWKRMLYIQRARVASAAGNKGCITLKEQIPGTGLEGEALHENVIWPPLYENRSKSADG